MFHSASSQLLFAVIRDIFLKSIHPAFVVPLIFFTFFLGGNLLPLCLVVHYGADRVQLSVTNVGNGTANIKATMIGNNGVTYTQTYNGINNIDANDLAFKLTIEKAHLVFDLPFANSSFAARKHYTRAHCR